MARGVLLVIAITSVYAEQDNYASIVTPIVQRNLEPEIATPGIEERRPKKLPELSLREGTYILVECSYT